MRTALMLLFITLLITCTSKKQVLYELPDAMLPHVKVQYAQQCDKGYTLWPKKIVQNAIQKKKRKTIIPDFKPEQLSGYALRAQNKQHETNLPDSTLSQEELGIIMTFLTYKKKNSNK
ncbi:MAG: hypothetical protein IPG08_10010 [Sphingobacteriaceae bacterium]|nr:hypothetical protein [Sphingobacteriaceae bacterium]